MTERDLLVKAHDHLNQMFRFAPRFFPAEANEENCPDLKALRDAWAVYGELGDYLYAATPNQGGESCSARY